MRLKQYYRSIDILKNQIVWLEGLDDKKYFTDIAKTNLLVAKCYLSMGIYESALNYCFQTTFIYLNEKDVSLQKEASVVQKAIIDRIKNKNKIFGE